MIIYLVLSNSCKIRVNHVFQNDQFCIDFPFHLSLCNANPAWCHNRKEENNVPMKIMFCISQPLMLTSSFLNVVLYNNLPLSFFTI